MSKFILNKNLSEHHCYFTGGEPIPDVYEESFNQIFFNGDREKEVYIIKVLGSEQRITTSYFIGVDWLINHKLAIQIEPKIDTSAYKTDFLKMLFQALKTPHISKHSAELFEVKINDPFIEVKKQDDVLTPFLVFRFLTLLKEIVRKGLRRDYVKSSQNLNSKIKGKILVSQTIRRNHFQARKVNTYCQFEEFTVNSIENKILKKAFNFCTVSIR